MLNSAPKQPTKYKQGLFTPNNKDKVIKLNSQGGLYYRSGLEQKMMIYLDNNSKIKFWGAEHLRIPYQKTEWVSETQEFKTTEHSSETKEPKLNDNPTSKQLKNFEYALKMYNKNLSKWKYMIEYCDRKGFEFIIITEQHLGGR
jgi:hypothetical protein